MSDDQVVTVCKASPVHRGNEVPSRTIAITNTTPTFDDISVNDVHGFYDGQARSILGALYAALPGGTLDSLFAQAAYDRASILRVARHLPDPPADDDVVDAEIDYSEAYTELAEMRLAALAIHKQAVWGACCDWCHYDDRDVPWPCPTAQALGVTA